MSRPVPGRSRVGRTSSDLVRLYLQDIGRFELLKADEELTLARLVQRRQQLLGQRQRREGDDPLLAELKDLERLTSTSLDPQQRQRLQASRCP